MYAGIVVIHADSFLRFCHRYNGPQGIFVFGCLSTRPYVRVNTESHKPLVGILPNLQPWYSCVQRRTDEILRSKGQK